MINVITSIFLWWIFFSSVSTFLCLVFKFQLIFHKESTMCIINMSLNYSNLCSFSFCMTLLCVFSSFWIRTMALSEYSFWIRIVYLILYTFSFEINQSRLSDIRCLIPDVVSPDCGDKRMARRCTRRYMPNYFDITSYHWNVRQNTVTWRCWMNGKNNVTSYTNCSLPQSIVYILIQPLIFV
jgi:hypothetical protein